MSEAVRTSRVFSGRHLGLCVLVVLLGVGAATAKPREIELRMGTLAPHGSRWHTLLVEMGQKWRDASDGTVQLRIQAGGQAGDEPDMVRKMRTGTIDAAALTIVGLSLITPEPQGLSVPRLLRTYDELDYVRDRIAPELEKKIGDKGFIVLNWADAGWIRFVSTVPVTSPAEMRKLKLFTWTGDQLALDLWQDFGFRPVPLAGTDILPSLRTGMIDAAPMTALTALATQTQTVARHLLAIEWAPLVGGTVIAERHSGKRKSKWSRIPADIQEKLRAIAVETGDRMRVEIREQDAEALEAMRKREVTIHELTPELEAQWTELAEKAWPRIREDIVGPAFFDRLLELRDQHRASVRASP